jgi:hypothetical protein
VNAVKAAKKGACRLMLERFRGRVAQGDDILV